MNKKDYKARQKKTENEKKAMFCLYIYVYIALKSTGNSN